MAVGWKLVVDAVDAPSIAAFWAAALEYEVEDPTRLVEQLLAAGQVPPEAVDRRDGRALFRGYAGIRHPDDPFDPVSGIGHGRRILFQDVPERKAGKNRLHIDVHGRHGAQGGLEALVTRLERLGATRLREVDQGAAGHWWVMQDPEGNEFCAT